MLSNRDFATQAGIVPLTTPIPFYALGALAPGGLAPVAWLVAGLAVLVTGCRRRRPRPRLREQPALA